MSANSLLLQDNEYLQSFLNQTNWEQRYYKTFFPLKFNPTLNYRTLIADKIAPVAADVVAYNTAAPEKTRRVVDQITGDIPASRVKRILDEVKLNEWNILRGQQNTPSSEIMDFIFEDPAFCFDAVESRREWMCMQALSNFTLSLSTTTNEPGVITQTDIDFQLPGARKRQIVAATTVRAWSNDTIGNYKPITDFEDVVQAAEDNGTSTPAWALMNTTSWRYFRKATEVLNFVLPNVQNKPVGVIPAAGMNLSGVNASLKEAGLPQIIIINTRVTIENSVHDLTTTNPWADNYVTFLPANPQVGNMLYGPLAVESFPAKQATYASRDGITISKFSIEDPINEITVGLSNCFPQIPKISEIWRLNHESAGTDGVE